MELARKVEEAIRRQRLLEPGMRVAVACSGGADSVALVRLLDELKGALGLRLLVVHLNHQLRGADADADEAFAQQLAERLELEFLVRREDVAARALRPAAAGSGQARQQRINVEEAGRLARQEFFASLIRGGRADAVATAHTLDDQAETVLARLLRGAGTRGLAGIYPVIELLPPEALAKEGRPAYAGAPAGKLVRPLLGVRRAELRVYLAECEQPWREDMTNLDRQRLRNRIRLDLLPQLNPAAIEHLGRLAEQARQEESFWEAYIEDRFRALVGRSGSEVEVEVARLLEPIPLLAGLLERPAAEAQRAVARRLLRRILAAVRGDLRRITQTHVEQVLWLAEQSQSGQRVVLPGAVVERRFDRVVFWAGHGAGKSKETRSAAAGDYAVTVVGPGCVRLPGGRALSFKLVAVAELEPVYNLAKGVADAAQVPFPLLVRNWRPGDAYQPAGATQRKKLKSLFQQRRVPVNERRRTPVVLCGEEIVWVPPFGVAASYGLGPRSHTALLIEERAGE